MGLAEKLNDAYRDTVPEDAEREAVRGALDKVERAMGASPQFAIAERHPCGSFAKETMLKGRKEAELVAVLAQAPTSTTLEELKAMGYALGRPLPTVVTAMKDTKSPFDIQGVPVHWWKAGTSLADRSVAFREFWARCIDRPPLVEPRN